jgi:hypothetical protein
MPNKHTINKQINQQSFQKLNAKQTHNKQTNQSTIISKTQCHLSLHCFEYQLLVDVPEASLQFLQLLFQVLILLPFKLVLHLFDIQTWRFNILSPKKCHVSQVIRQAPLLT